MLRNKQYMQNEQNKQGRNRGRVAFFLFSVLFTLFFSFSVFAGIPLKDSGVSVTQEQISAVAQRYSKIPGSIRQEFERNGNSIYFFETQPVIEGNTVAYVLGVYMGNEGVNSSITLTNESFGGAEAIVHEMGHYFDDMIYPDSNSRRVNLDFMGIRFIYTTGGKRLRSEDYDFGWIWLAEAFDNYAVTDYEKSDKNEYFAGSFQEYVLNPAKLYAAAPMTYKFIDRLVREFCRTHPAESEEYMDSYSSQDNYQPGAVGGYATWEQDAEGWRLRLSDGSYPSGRWALVDGDWYYFDERGYIATGWKELDGNWYYLFGNGKMATGWLAVDGERYYFSRNGQMLRGRHEIGGRFYYFDPKTGALWQNGYSPEGFKIKQNGELIISS